MDTIHVFVDESGSFGFKFESPNCTTHLILCAALVSEKDLQFVTEEVERIRYHFFKSGEMKSVNIKNKAFKRRRLILQELLKLPINYAIYIVDKKGIDESSKLREYKKSFYKFFYQKLYASLINKIKCISIHPDKIGSDSDIEEFKKYYYKRNDTYNLFHDIDFAFDDSKNSLLIQVADIVGGSLAKNIDESKHNTNDTTDYLSLLRSKIILREDFPQDKETFLKQSNFDSEYDRQIAEIALMKVDDFIEQHQDSDDIDEKQQVAILQYLRYRFMQNQFRLYIRTSELQKHLLKLGYDRISTSTFRMRVIAKLRDNGVILASSSNGYKIPSKVSEVYDFINHGGNVIMPMLRRLKICNEAISVGTNKSIDLLDKPELQKLREILDLLS